jgi:hypothetical protein
MASHPSITGLSPTGKCNFMLFGATGVGKTSMIAQGKRTLIVRPPTDHVDAAIRLGATCDEWIVEHWAEMEEVEEFARHNPREYDWIWWDGISLAQDHLLEDKFETMNAGKSHRKNGPIDKGEYNANFSHISKWLRHMIGIRGFNFGVTAHPAEIEDNLGEVKLRPWVQGKNMSFKVCGMMNVVGMLEVVTQGEKERRVLRLKATDEYDAKDQFGIGGDKGRLVDPTMAKIEAALPAKRAAGKRTRVKRKR